jgi:hypothetical protein
MVTLLHKQAAGNASTACVPIAVREFRLSTLDTLTANSIPIKKLDAGDGFDLLLEKGGFSLGGTRTMNDLIPVLHEVCVLYSTFKFPNNRYFKLL